MTLLILLIVGACAAFGLTVVSLMPRSSARRRLVRLADGSRAPAPDSERVSLIGDDAPPWLVRLLGVFSSGSSSEGPETRGQLRQRLVEAGYRRPTAVSTFMAARVSLAVAFPFVALAVPQIWQLQELQVIVVLFLATGFGYLAPSFWVDRRSSRRKLAIQHALPDALDLMVVCVQAGLGIVASLDRVVRDLARTHPELTSEFELTIYEIRAGKSTSDGLRSLGARTGVSEVSALVSMLVQNERFGTSIADTLRVHADALRSRRMQRAEELANKAPLKMLFPTTLIFFATLVVSLGPAVAEILAFFEKH